MNQLKYFLYARRSSEGEEKQVASIESQIVELQKMAKQNDLEIVEVFKESKSAKAPGRPVFNEMMARIHKGHANGVICWKLDRLARNPVDGGTIHWMLQEGVLQHIRAYDRNYYPTDNVLMMSVEFGMANQFIRDLSSNTKRGLLTKAQHGWFPGQAPIGYSNTTLRNKGEKEIVPADIWPQVKKLFEIALTGQHTVPKILEIGSKKLGVRYADGRKISRSTMYHILTNPFYSGVFEYPRGSGTWYQGKHKPIISQADFDKLQIILGNKHNTRPQTLSFLYRGKMRCADCGCLITAENKTKRQKNGNVHFYTYYHCTRQKTNFPCTQPSIEQDALETALNKCLAGIKIPRDFMEWSMDYLKRTNKEESETREQKLTTFRKQYDACTQKIDRLIDMRANNELSEEEFKTKKEILVKEKNHFNGLLNDADAGVDNWLAKAEELCTFAHTAADEFAKGSPERKREIVLSLASNLFLKDKKAVILGDNKLLTMEKISQEVNRILSTFEPLETSTVEQQKRTLYEQNPILLPGSDSN